MPIPTISNIQDNNSYIKKYKKENTPISPYLGFNNIYL